MNEHVCEHDGKLIRIDESTYENRQLSLIKWANEIDSIELRFVSSERHILGYDECGVPSCGEQKRKI